MILGLPADIFLDDTPFCANLLVDFVHSGQLFFFPLVGVEVRVQGIDPLFPAFDFGSLEAFLSKSIGYLLPFLGVVKGV